MLTNPTFWFAVSFVMFFVLFGRRVWLAIASGLDGRSHQIELDIREAMRMREEAQELLMDIKTKKKEADRHAEAILEHARLEAERLRSESAKELDEYLKQREIMVDQRITFAEKEALKDIRDTAVRMAIEASEKILSHVVTPDVDSRLADNAIGELTNKKIA